MRARTAELLLFQDLEDSSRSRNLTDSDVKALHTVADWIKTLANWRLIEA
jgi:hypothetical protein